MYRSRKPEYAQAYRGFESHPLRQINPEPCRAVAVSIVDIQQMMVELDARGLPKHVMLDKEGGGK